MTSGWLCCEKSYFLKARDGNPKKVFLTGTLLILLTLALTWRDRLLAHLNTKRFGTGMNACFQRHATWIVWGQYSNYRWCEQEMEILCGLKVPQRPCRHLFIHKPVSVLQVSSHNYIVWYGHDKDLLSDVMWSHVSSNKDAVYFAECTFSLVFQSWFIRSFHPFSWIKSNTVKKH